jgi:AcrR family transcriptional regulator
MPPTSAPRTARERARADITTEITASARRQLAEHGAAALSLRAVARDLGMVSSAVYRYFASRDDLLTALIIESYDALGEAAEAAARSSRRRSPRHRWVAVAAAIRAWAQAHPHEYALLYGSPVPGYAAPADTTVAGTRASFALLSVVRDAAASRALVATVPVAVPAALAAELRALRATVDLDVDDEVLVAVLLGWTQLFGLLGFELFGQTRGVVEDHGALFTTATTTMAAAIGLW